MEGAPFRVNNINELSERLRHNAHILSMARTQRRCSYHFCIIAIILSIDRIQVLPSLNVERRRLPPRFHRELAAAQHAHQPLRNRRTQLQSCR